jgi:hypothetical protein
LTAVDVVGCLLATLLLLLVDASGGWTPLLWLSSGLFGLSLASVFPSTFTLLGARLLCPPRYISFTQPRFGLECTYVRRCAGHAGKKHAGGIVQSARSAWLGAMPR